MPLPLNCKAILNNLMGNTAFQLLLILIIVVSRSTNKVSAVKSCGPCGRTVVPYPLSTGPDCGDQLYKIRCTAGELWFDAVNKSSYMISSINPQNQRITIKPPSIAAKTCVSSDYEKQGIQLDENLPFNITSSNTILLINCSVTMLNLQAPINCSSNCICHDYIRENAAAAPCNSAPLCCMFKAGGSQTAYRIRIYSGGCAVYQSFVNLDGRVPAKKWSETGLELEWMLPQEPTCKSPIDCKELLHSMCLPHPSIIGLKKCLCNTGFMWDAVNGLCQKVKCKHGKGCKSKKKKKRMMPLMIAFPMVGVLLVISLAILIKKFRQQTKKEAHNSMIKEREEILNAHSLGKSAKIFSGREITRATNNFSKENLIGTGGFGEVFKGVLEDGTITAIKRAKHGNTKGTDQVLNEVRILCQVHHRNLVGLLGCCVELEEPLMIYEYISNGTLFEHLHCTTTNTTKWQPLTWLQRLRIAHQTAEGLAYLHFSATPPIYHRDVKTSNILLDEKLHAKVSDFGLSRLVQRGETNDTHIFTEAQGTLGYLDPEYYRNFQLTDKSDVYSFGIVLLELLTSKRAIDFNRGEEEVNLAIYVKRMMDEERLMDVVDPLIKNEASKVKLETVKALGFLAGACLDDRRQNRPSMKEVEDEIECIISIVTGEEDVAKL